MTSIAATTENTSQPAIVNSIRQNMDTKAAIHLYINNNSKRSTMIAMSAPDFHIENSCMPNFEEENTLCYYLTWNNDQEFYNFRSVLP